MSESPSNPSRTAPVLAAVLALVAVGLMAFAALDRSWFVAESADGDFAIGLVSAEMCVGGQCREAPLSAFSVAAETPKLGVAVLLVSVLVCLLLFAATARKLLGRQRFAWLPKVALGGVVFAAVLAGAWLLLSPWSETMVPGLAPILFFIGAGIGAATAAIPLGGLRRG